MTSKVSLSQTLDITKRPVTQPNANAPDLINSNLYQKRICRMSLKRGNSSERATDRTEGRVSLRRKPAHSRGLAPFCSPLSRCWTYPPSCLVEAESEQVFSEGAWSSETPYLPFYPTQPPPPPDLWAPSGQETATPDLMALSMEDSRKQDSCCFALFLAGESVRLTNIPKCV